jgi:hypothetical protein
MRDIDWEFADRLADRSVRDWREQNPEFSDDASVAMHELQAIYQALIDAQMPDTYTILSRLIRLQHHANRDGYNTAWSEATSW